MLLLLRFWLDFSLKFRSVAVFLKIFKKFLVHQNKNWNSEQLLFWTSSHISTLNAIFWKFWLFLQKLPKFDFPKKIWPRKKVDFEVEILKIFQKFFFHENKRLIANNFYFGLFVISLTVFSLKYIFQINLKNVISKR